MKWHEQKRDKDLSVGYIGNIPDPVGGAEVFLDRLICHLSAYPIKIVLARWLKQTIDLGKGSSIHFEYRQKETIEFDHKRKIKVYYLFDLEGSSLISTLSKFFSQSFKLVRFFRREEVNIIHCHLLIPNIYYAYLVSKILNLPLLVTVHGIVDLTEPGHIFGHRKLIKMERKLLLWLLRRCDRVIGVSDEIIRYSKDRGIVNIEKKSAGVDTEFFCPGNLEEKGILFVGNLNHRKGFDLLLEAYPSIEEQFKEPLYLVGKNPDGLNCKEPGVIYLGILDQEKLVRMIQKSKLVVLPSRTEGLPLSVIEAMACNKLVLVSPVGELTNVIKDGYNGFFLRNFSAGALRDQMSEILNRYQTIKIQIGEKPRQTVSIFDIRKITGWHWNLYQQISGSNQHYKPSQKASDAQ